MNIPIEELTKFQGEYELYEKHGDGYSIDLWKKYNNDGIIYFVGYLHNSFNVNEVDGISEII